MSRNDDLTHHRIHRFGAGTSALGGTITSPFHRNIPGQAALNLPSVGGYASVRVEEFESDSQLSFASAHAEVSGDLDRHHPVWNTMSTITVEGLNVFGVITADRVVARIITEHPTNPDAAGEGKRAWQKVSFLGTQFTNLRISGVAVTVALDYDLFGRFGDGAFPSEPANQRPSFLKHANQHCEQMTQKGCPRWMTDRYGSRNPEAQSMTVVSTLVNKIEVKGSLPGTQYGNAFDLPGFGRVILGELAVDSNSFYVTMMRLELGCPVAANLALVEGHAHGSTHP